MTALIVANTIAAAVVIAGLAGAMRLGHQTAGGRFDRMARRFEFRRGGAERIDEADQREAA